jgi:hypothetical protein
MKYPLLYFVTFLVYIINISAQDTAKVSIPFLMYDNAGGQKMLYFGVDSTATDSIDINLGESDLPPFPPPGVFEARWILPQNGFNGSLSSYLDYRNMPVLPYTDTVEYRIRYQGANGADTMFFSWDFPVEVTALMQDLVTGTIVNVPMSGSGVFGLANFSVLDQMKLTVYYNAVTPVELISFTTNVNDNTVILNWITATEINNQGFEVERQVGSRQLAVGNPPNGEASWEKIGYVTGFGTTTEPKSYSFADNQLTTGNYTYRLKQIDFDGSYEYSNEVSVKVDFTPKEYTLYQNYPNPFNPGTKIDFSLATDSKVTLSVFNILGEKVAVILNNSMSAGNHSVNFKAQGLNSGVYFYRIEAKGNDGTSFLSTKKMAITK